MVEIRVVPNFGALNVYWVDTLNIASLTFEYSA